MSQNNSIILKSIETIEMRSHLKSFLVLTIQNFIDLNEPELQSSFFSIGYAKWCVNVLPRNTENDQYISVFLHLSKSKTNVVNAEYSVEVIDSNNQLFHAMNAGLHQYPKQSDWGFKRLLRRDQLNKDLMPNKEFRLHFAIDLFDCNQNNVIENQVINDCHKLINNKVSSDLYSLSTIRSFMRIKAYYLFVRKYLRSHLPMI